MSRRPTLFLASASPRRGQLIQFIQPGAIVVPSRYDEPPLPTQVAQPAKLVKELAAGKAGGAIVPKGAVGWVLGADTLVWAEGRPLGKPKDQKEAAAMLSFLSGREHRVYTGIALAPVSRAVVDLSQARLAHAMTRVRFRPLTRKEINAYLEVGEWTDKAGSYGGQGAGMSLIESVHGCWTNVVGLPVKTTLELWQGVQQ